MSALLDKCLSGLERVGTGLVCLSLLSVALFGGADVICTYLLGQPLPLARELPEVALPTIVFLGVSHAIREGALVRIDLFDPLLTGPLGNAVRLVGLACSVAFFAVIAWFGWSMALDAFDKNETANALIRFPIWPFKMAMALAMTLCVIEAIRALTKQHSAVPRDGS